MAACYPGLLMQAELRYLHSTCNTPERWDAWVGMYSSTAALCNALHGSHMAHVGIRACTVTLPGTMTAAILVEPASCVLHVSDTCVPAAPHAAAGHGPSSGHVPPSRKHVNAGCTVLTNAGRYMHYMTWGCRVHSQQQVQRHTGHHAGYQQEYNVDARGTCHEAVEVDRQFAAVARRSSEPCPVHTPHPHAHPQPAPAPTRAHACTCMPAMAVLHRLQPATHPNGCLALSVMSQGNSAHGKGEHDLLTGAAAAAGRLGWSLVGPRSATRSKCWRP